MGALTERQQRRWRRTIEPATGVILPMAAVIGTLPAVWQA
jgi:hypothetical protein